MSATQLLQFQDRKLRLLEDEAQALQTEDQGQNGDFFAIVEQLVSDCLRLPEDMQHLWKRTRQVITSGARVDYQATGDMLKETFARLLRLLTNVHSLGADISGATGHEVERHGELIEAMATLRNMETRILSAWPWPDEPLPAFDLAKIEEARQAILRGEGEEVTDIMARLEGGRPIHEGA
jgi:hypothetical protein